tara:strand:- start:557 stop:877 length:321 start_codon:yes stop_codon:yes gene_type:complete
MKTCYVREYNKDILHETAMTKAKVILDRFPYRFVEVGKLEINGMPDFRILKYNEVTDHYQTMYYLDSQMQLDCALEDPEYVKWLDPDPEVAAYPNKSDTVSYQPAM